MRVSRALTFRISKMTTYVVATFGFMCVLATLDAPVASADNCANDNGMFAQVNVFMRIENHNGTLVGYGKGFSFNVKATVPGPDNYTNGSNKSDLAKIQRKRLIGQGSTLNPSAPRAAINNNGGNPHGSSNYNTSMTNPSQTVEFTATNSNLFLCDRGQGRHPAFAFTDGSNNNPFLDCLGGGYVINSGVADKWLFTAKYEFTATGAPTTYVDKDNNNQSFDVPPGGSWVERNPPPLAPTSNRDVNEIQGNIIFTYRLPPPPPEEHFPTGSITVVCSNQSTSQQRITYSFNDPDGVSTGSITSNAGFTASGLSETGGSTLYHQPDSGGKTYTLTVTNPRVAGGFGTSATWSVISPTCNAPSTDHPPTGSLTYSANCTASNTSHFVTYWNLSDQNGGSPRGKVTTSSSSSSSSVVHGPTTGGTFTRPHGVVTYYLWVENINISGGSTGDYGSSPKASVTTHSPQPCPVAVEIDPYAKLTDAGGAPLSGSSVAPGTQVRTLTRVYNNGNVSTSSNWTREFWYDNNGNSTYDSGEIRIATASTGGPTTYPALVNTSVATVGSTPGSGVDGTKTRICVSLNLYGVASSPTTTVRSPNPEVDCKNIAANNILDPEVGITGNLEPGQTIRADAWVNVSSPSANGESDYERLFWYERGNLDNSLDGDDISISGPNPSGHLVYTSPTRSLAQWSDTVPNDPSITYVCTSLRLYGEVNVTGITAPNPDPDCKDVATQYFFQVTHGDVGAIGCLFDDVCNPTVPDTKISAFNRGSDHRGAGSQIGVFSTGSITEFTSGNNPAPLHTATSPKKFTFANSGGTYGGGFGQRYQIDDYWTGPAVGDNDVNGSEGPLVRQPGNVLVRGSKTVGGVGVGSITYTDGSALQWVIARGDIYIDRSVTQLHGVYIAKGNIYTCTNGFTRYTLPSPTMASECEQPLNIKGALIAGNSIKLLRTAGSLSSTPAETIEYNPFVWMQGINPVNSLPTSTSGKLDFITTLPPIL